LDSMAVPNLFFGSIRRTASCRIISGRFSSRSAALIVFCPG
jgi:hypothetical protein